MLERRGSIRILAELPGGYTGARVFVADEQVTPDDPQPFSLVFKVANGAVLREEVERYQNLRRHVRAHKSFAEIIEPGLTLRALLDDYDCAIAYEHVAAAFGRRECVSLKDVIGAALGDSTRIAAAHEILETTMKALTSMYAHPQMTFAFDVARYYMDRWLPHFRIAIEQAIDLSSQWLLTRHRLNPAYFYSEQKTQPDIVSRAGELPNCDLPEDVVLPMLSVRQPVRGAFIVQAPELSLEVDLSALTDGTRKTLATVDSVSIWAAPDREGRRYIRYRDHLQRAFLGEDLSRPVVALGGHWFHNPLHHLSLPLIERTRPPIPTRAVPAHGDLHPGNVLVVGTSPIIIDYGLSEPRAPIGIDAARLFGGLVRDVYSDAFTVDELTVVLRAVVLSDAGALADAPVHLVHAASLLECVQSLALAVMGEGAAELWALHLYGFAFIGLKWDAEPPRAHAACGLLAAVALTKLLGTPSPDELLTVRRPAEAHAADIAPDIAPEAPAEILVLVAKFHGAAEYDPTMRVYQALADNLYDVISDITRVEYVDTFVLSRKDAIVLARRYQASMVVWGSYDSLGIRPRYEVTRDSILARQSMIQLDEATRHNLQEKFEVYITEDLGSEISFLSLKAVADMCMLNLNHSAALRVYHKALSLVTRHERLLALGAPAVHRSIAGILFGLRKHQEAIAANVRAAELAPDDILTRIQALTIRGAVEKRSVMEMIEDLRVLIRERSANAADVELRTGLNAALESLEAIKSPNDLFELTAKAHRTATHYDSGRNSQFKKDVAVHLQKGDTFLERDEFRKSHKEYDLALRLNPRCAAAMIGRAKVLAYTDHVAAALRELERAERIDRDEPAIYILRGYIMFEISEYQKCLQSVEQLRRFDVPLAATLRPWGLSLVALGRGAEMMAVLKNENLSPDTPGLFEVRAAYFRRAGQLDTALREIEEGLHVDSDDQFALQERARIYLAMNLLAPAFADARRAASFAKRGTFDHRKAEELVRAVEVVANGADLAAVTAPEVI
jgi:tetratricopeptide (TPR) repeat protein